MRVLITNDDGVDSPGLPVLVAALVAAGHDVLAVAPAEDRSGTGTALGVRAGVPITVSERPPVHGARVLGIDGGPALAVMLTRMGAFGAVPDIVLSGINAGANTGRAVLHSATVGAALTAATVGYSAMAVSAASPAPRHWDTAAAYAVRGLEWLAAARRRTVLNVNVPDLSEGEVTGVRYGRLAAYGPTSLAVAETTGETIVLTAVAQSLPLDPESDVGIVAAGMVSVTLLEGVRAVSGPDAPTDLATSLTGPVPAAR